MVVPLPCLEACDTVSTAPLITPKSVGGRADDSPLHHGDDSPRTLRERGQRDCELLTEESQ